MKSVAALCFVADFVFAASSESAAADAAAGGFLSHDLRTVLGQNPPERSRPFLFWLSGYFGHKNNSAVLDPTGFTEKTKALSQYCSKQPSDNVLSAAEKAFAN